MGSNAYDQFWLLWSLVSGIKYICIFRFYSSCEVGCSENVPKMIVFRAKSELMMSTNICQNFPNIPKFPLQVGIFQNTFYLSINIPNIIQILFPAFISDLHRSRLPVFVGNEILLTYCEEI